MRSRGVAGLLAAALALGSAGCGRYADFTLAEPPGPRRAIRYRVEEVRPAPVLGRGAPGDWDAVDVLNPSVFRYRDTYYNLYSGYDGHTWHTGLAVSNDGLNWVKRGQVLSPDSRTWEGDYIAANGSLLAQNGTFFYWYQGGRLPRIGLARSSAGVLWRKEARPVLPVGPRGSWDERGVADPYVVKFGEWLYMFYLGQDRARRQRLGIARSAGGLHWAKLRSNPILELGAPGAFDEVGLGEPAVWARGGWYWMLYTGRDRQERRRLGLARSPDGVRWERVSPAPVFSGAGRWESQVVCDPAVELRDHLVRVWYGGGDVPRPDEGLHGQIGMFVLAEEGGN